MPISGKAPGGAEDGPLSCSTWAALWKRLALLNRSQNWLAREIGISPGYVSKLVNTGRSPSGRIRRRMLKALELTEFGDLFRLEDSDEQQ